MGYHWKMSLCSQCSEFMGSGDKFLLPNGILLEEHGSDGMQTQCAACRRSP
ncbi:MAG: hypothetical protein KatS3mg051_2045 [Anaerolineae bacterium]|nr:MAG: hypothetical protein KatS3mg051_2045 [Anaerolineae bacterium]